MNLSVAAPEIAKYFHWDPAQMGWIFSAYLWTYTVCLIPIGALLDRYGARRVSAIGVALWSAAAMTTGAVTNFSTMVLARLGLGVGEATTFPVAGKVIRQWFPAKERGFAGAVFHCGGHAAPAFATPFVAWVVVRQGWRASFVILGALGLVWLVFWLWKYREPEDCPWLSADERQFIVDNRDSGPSGAAANTGSGSTAATCEVLAALFRQPTVWGIMLTQGCSTYFNYLFLAWLPTYLVQVRGLHLMQAGIQTAIPYLVAVVVVLGFGKLSDGLLSAESLKKGKRRNVLIAALLLSTVVMLINVVETQTGVLVVLALAMSFNLTCLTLNLVLANDLLEEPQIAGTVFALVATSANLFGLLAPIITGYIVKATGSFAIAFNLLGAIVIAAAAISFTLTRKRIHGPAWSQTT